MWPFFGSNNGCQFYVDHGSVSGPNVVNGIQLKDTSLDIVDLPLTSFVPDPVIHSTDLSKRLDGESAEENDFSNATLRYINQVLMEDDLEDKTCTIHDSSVHAAEKSFFETLNNTCPSPSNQSINPLEDSSSYCSINANNSSKFGIISDLHKYESSLVHNSYIDHTLLTNSQSLQCPSFSCCACGFAGRVESLVNTPSESQHSYRFNRGIEETKKKVLSCGNCGTFDFENNRLIPPVAKENNFEAQVTLEEDEEDLPDSLARGRKSHRREKSELEEERSNKYLLSVYGESEQSVLHEIFDKTLSLCGKNDASALTTTDVVLQNAAIGEPKQNDLAKRSNGEMTYTGKGTSKREAINLRNLLMQCMQSVASGDHRRTNKLLMQIRLCSSPLGDGPQRLAHYFANSLQARLVGARNLEHKAFACISTSDPAILKAYKLYISAFPFVEILYSFANQMIMEQANKATCIHIVNFGMVYGIEWPPLIQHLSMRPGGPPKLRITGIDFPQAGFRPAARVKETGCHLANYCEKFGVPFEYNGIAQKWETVSAEDLKIEKGEVLVVYSMYMSKYQLDDTIMEPSPRDAVLNLIKSISPDIFIHGIKNATYNSPFFALRFREALFHFSTLFDMFEANVSRENRDRLVLERDIWGEEILNVVACEGLERIARPETYKQWQSRTLRAGFKQVPLNQEMMKKVKAKVKASYHKDFFVDESNQWMLQGWKGRVIFALSCWKPV